MADEGPSWQHDDAAMASFEAMEEVMVEVERKILDHHTMTLEKWTREQELALQGAVGLDDGALQVKASTNEAFVKAIESDSQTYAKERADAIAVTTASRSTRLEEMRAELHELGEARAKELAEAVQKHKRSLRGCADELEADALKRMEGSFHSVVLKNSADCGIAHLQPYLDIERDGWARSQDTDVARLRQEIDTEFEGIFGELQAKLKAVLPACSQVAPMIAQLSGMADTEKERLTTVCDEVCGSYTSEINAALHQCEEDYRGYDSHLQEVLFTTLENRAKHSHGMRELKLALCRWRLDYQKTYHEHRDKVSANLARDGPPDSADEGNVSRTMSGSKRNSSKRDIEDPLVSKRRHLDKLRRSVLRVWSQSKVPVPEIHKFLARVTGAVAREGHGEPILKLYMEELNQYGALPLLDHADNPEVLKVWLDSMPPK